jgi:signal transduction histidine kinase
LREIIQYCGNLSFALQQAQPEINPMRFYFLIFALLFALFCKASPIIDSLRSIVNSDTDPKKHLSAFAALAFEYHKINPDSAIYYSTKGISYSQQAANKFEEASNLNMLGLAYYRKGWYGLAEEKFKEAVKLFKLIKEDEQESRVYLNLAQLFQSRKDYKSAFDYNTKALKYFEITGDSMHIGVSYQTLSIVSRELGLYAEAESYLNNAERIFRTLKLTDELAINASLKGNLFKTTGRYSEAIKFYELSLQLYEQASDQSNKAICLENMAVLYEETGMNQKALIYYDRALAIFRELNSETDIAYEQMKSSLVRSKLGFKEQASKQLDSALVYFRLNKLPEYELECLLFKSQQAEINNDPKKALDYYKQYNLLDDSLQKAMKLDELSRLQAEFNAERQVVEIKLLKTEKETQKTQLILRNYLIIAFALLFVVVLFGIAYYRKRRQLMEELEKQKLLTRIASDLHDDVGATLSSISMFGEMIRKKSETSAPELTPLAEKVTNNARETVKTMSDIVWTIKPGNDTFTALCDRIENFAIDICSPKQIKLLFVSPDRDHVQYLNSDIRTAIYLVAKEAINNAVKYSGSPNLEVKIYLEGKKIRLFINDSGTGFDNLASKGNGLENMKSRAEKHAGEFQIHTAEGKGTRIEVSFSIPDKN